MRRLGLEQYFFDVQPFLKQLGEFLEHIRRIGLAVVDNADNFTFERVQARHQRPFFRIYHRSWIKKFKVAI